jgi:hypothetical protein
MRCAGCGKPAYSLPWIALKATRSWTMADAIQRRVTTHLCQLISIKTKCVGLSTNRCALTLSAVLLWLICLPIIASLFLRNAPVPHQVRIPMLQSFPHALLTCTTSELTMAAQATLASRLRCCSHSMPDEVMCTSLYKYFGQPLLCASTSDSVAPTASVGSQRRQRAQSATRDAPKCLAINLGKWCTFFRLLHSRTLYDTSAFSRQSGLLGYQHGTLPSLPRW